MSEKWEPGHWLQDTHAIAAPLARDVYWPDGQMRDVAEAYNYVPFKQSKMFAVGVTCSNCHDPHSAKQRIAGDGVCLQCHAGQSTVVISKRVPRQIAFRVTCRRAITWWSNPATITACGFHGRICP